MQRRYPHNVYMYCGSIYDMDGCIIEDPALLIDRSTGCVHGYGRAESVAAKFEAMSSAYRKNGFEEEADGLLMLDFSGAYYRGVTREEVCYVLRRAVEYTATSFQEGLCAHAMKDDFRDWLRSEMQRVPIDLEEKEF